MRSDNTPVMAIKLEGVRGTMQPQAQLTSGDQQYPLKGKARVTGKNKKRGFFGKNSTIAKKNQHTYRRTNIARILGVQLLPARYACLN